MTELFTKSFSNKSNAKRAALKEGLKPDEFTVEPDGFRFAVRRAAVSLDESLKIAEEAFKAMTPAARAELVVIDPIAEHVAPAAKAKSKKVEAAPEVADEVRSLFQVKAPRAQHIEALEAARKGFMPVPPDLSKPSFGYTKRKYLDKIEEALAAGDIAGVKAIAEGMKVSLWEQRAVRAYGLLAVIAKGARA
jgi:soluble cytochrome b562